MWELAAFAMFLVAAWVWVVSMRAREAAIEAGRRACEAERVQLLDWTVALKKIRFMRNPDGRMQLQRTYEFEYSDTGNNRLNGSVTLLGSKLHSVHLQQRTTYPHDVVNLH